MGDAALAEATQLVKLNASWNGNVTTVEPFGSTLIELVAVSRSCGITDAGLATATNLVCLLCVDNKEIQSVRFGSTLLELIANDVRIGNEALSHATQRILVSLFFASERESDHNGWHHLASLRHLFADGSSLTDARLNTATNLSR